MFFIHRKIPRVDAFFVRNLWDWAIAPYYKALEIFNMNLPFFPIIYNIIFDCFFIDISMASPGAVLSLPDKGQEGHKKSIFLLKENVLFEMG